jgi:signal transduction histidine kinase
LVQQRTAKLQEVIDELEAFSYSMAHDLRGPSRSLTGLTGLLREDHYEQLNQAGRDYVDRIGAAAARMHALIRDVLTYSQLSRQALRLQPVPLGTLLQTVREQYIHLKDARIDVGRLPTVLGHEAALTQVFSNLLSNAAKFVPADRTPEVVVEGEDATDREIGPSAVVISIRDNGIGIAPADLERSFPMFERLHPPGEYEGTGIGPRDRPPGARADGWQRGGRIDQRQPLWGEVAESLTPPRSQVYRENELQRFQFRTDVA